MTFVQYWAMRTPTPATYRLRLPGPTEVPERVRDALARPVLNRSPRRRAAQAPRGRRRFVRGMYKRFTTVIAGARNRLAGLGWQTQPGAALAAASAQMAK